MKYIYTAAAAMLLAGNLIAQSEPAPATPILPMPQQPGEPSADELKKKFDEEAGQECFKKAPWIMDYDKAREESKKGGKLILGYFTRSYAPCGYCKQFESTTLSDEKFPAWGKDFVLFCHITTKITGRKYDDLLEKVGGQGFPHIVFMDADGDVLAVHQDAREMDAMTKTAGKAKEAAAVKQRSANGDANAKIDWFCHQIDNGQLNYENSQKKIKDLGKLTTDQQKKVDAAVFDLQVNALFEETQKATSQEDFEKRFTSAGKQALAWLKEKRIPKNDMAFGTYINGIFAYSDSQKDADSFALGVAAIKEREGNNEKMKPIIETLEKHVAELRTAKSEAKPADEKKDDKKEK